MNKNDEKVKKPTLKDVNGDKKQNLCPTCNKVIIGSTYKFNCHLYNKHQAVAARFSCPHCSKQYYRNDEFKRHMSQHSGDYKIKNKNLFMCDICDRSFVDKRNLLKHHKVHDDNFTAHPNVKTHRCLACKISYTEERSLKHHIRRVHNNREVKEPKFMKKPVNDTWMERVLESDVCVQVTKLNNNVIAIKKCEEKVADDLNKSFLNAKEIRSSQYSMATCDYCKKEMLKKSLRLHIKERHTTIRTFTCKVCKNAYNRHYQLVNHICGKPRNKQRVKASKKQKKVK